MAKDGTNRGGARPGAGRKKKDVSIKIAEGKILGANEALPKVLDLIGGEMPKPAAFLKKIQKDGKSLGATQIYADVWTWIYKKGCADLIRKEKIEAFALCYARFAQCERAISEYGLLGKHPTTGGAIASPYVAMSQTYLNQANRLWEEISSLVRQYSEGADTQGDDMMEHLLERGRKA